MAMELIPPGCHRRNAAEVAIRNFKAHFLSALAGARIFPLHYGTASSHRKKYHSTCCGNPTRHQRSQLTRTCADRSIITRCPSHQWDAQYRCMKRQTSGAHARTTPSTDGIHQLPPNIIARTDVTLKLPKVIGSLTQSTSVTKISRDQPSPMQIRS